MMTRQVRTVQRVEAGAVALIALVAAVVLYPAWWWVTLAAFLLFDLSMLGYVRSTAAGATSYNLVHNYALPAVAGVAALVLEPASPVASTAAGVLACAWAFHVGVDRALGYGLKLPDSFRNTHLGRIGKDSGHRDPHRDVPTTGDVGFPDRPARQERRKPPGKISGGFRGTC